MSNQDTSHVGARQQEVSLEYGDARPWGACAVAFIFGALAIALGLCVLSLGVVNFDPGPITFACLLFLAGICCIVGGVYTVPHRK